MKRGRKKNLTKGALKGYTKFGKKTSEELRKVMREQLSTIGCHDINEYVYMVHQELQIEVRLRRLHFMASYFNRL